MKHLLYILILTLACGCGVLIDENDDGDSGSGNKIDSATDISSAMFLSFVPTERSRSEIRNRINKVDLTNYATSDAEDDCVDKKLVFGGTDTNGFNVTAADTIDLSPCFTGQFAEYENWSFFSSNDVMLKVTIDDAFSDISGKSVFDVREMVKAMPSSAVSVDFNRRQRVVFQGKIKGGTDTVIVIGNYLSEGPDGGACSSVQAIGGALTDSACNGYRSLVQRINGEDKDKELEILRHEGLSADTFLSKYYRAGQSMEITVDDWSGTVTFSGANGLPRYSLSKEEDSVADFIEAGGTDEEKLIARLSSSVYTVDPDGGTFTYAPWVIFSELVDGRGYGLLTLMEPGAETTSSLDSWCQGPVETQSSDKGCLEITETGTLSWYMEQSSTKGDQRSAEFTIQFTQNDIAIEARESVGADPDAYSLTEPLTFCSYDSGSDGDILEVVVRLQNDTKLTADRLAYLGFKIAAPAAGKQVAFIKGGSEAAGIQIEQAATDFPSYLNFDYTTKVFWDITGVDDPRCDVTVTEIDKFKVTKGTIACNNLRIDDDEFNPAEAPLGNLVNFSANWQCDRYRR